MSPVRFLVTAYEPNDWAAVFLKSYEGGRVAQRVGPMAWLQSHRVQRWLRAMNSQKFNIYVSVNTISAGRLARTRDAIGSVRHLFLDADHDGDAVLSRMNARRDLPSPSYLLHSSPNRVHLFWRVTGFDANYIEHLQKQLAHELGTDPAATPITQMTRLPGFFNHKYREPHLVTIEYRNVNRRFGPGDFPQVRDAGPQPPPAGRRHEGNIERGVVERAGRYLSFVPPAISGQHGDLHTFRVCCRLTRGFALDDAQALAVLSEWNGRCEPPWTTAELMEKLRCAARYGREPFGGLL
ncbi:MAG: DNA-primase RepB domain-containing protein [Vicinamibacterales bacterium]